MKVKELISILKDIPEDKEVGLSGFGNAIAVFWTKDSDFARILAKYEILFEKVEGD